MIRLFRNRTALKITSIIVVFAFLLPLAGHPPILAAILTFVGLAYSVYRGIKWYKRRNRKMEVVIDLQRHKERQDDITYH